MRGYAPKLAPGVKVGYTLTLTISHQTFSNIKLIVSPIVSWRVVKSWVDYDGKWIPQPYMLAGYIEYPWTGCAQGG